MTVDGLRLCPTSIEQLRWLHQARLDAAASVISGFEEEFADNPKVLDLSATMRQRWIAGVKGDKDDVEKLEEMLGPADSFYIILDGTPGRPMAGYAILRNGKVVRKIRDDGGGPVWTK